MKKILLGLGSLVAIITPTATLIACGTTETVEVVEKNLDSTKSETELNEVKNIAIYSINDAEEKLGLTFNEVQVEKYNSIIWDNKNLKLTVVLLYTGKTVETKIIYTVIPKK